MDFIHQLVRGSRLPPYTASAFFAAFSAGWRKEPNQATAINIVTLISDDGT